MNFRNIDMSVIKNPSHFRKLSMGNWDSIGNPQAYAVLDLDVENALKYLEKLRNQHDINFTLNHLIGRIVALNIRKYPQINGHIARGKIYCRENADIFFQVCLEDAETELVGISVKEGDKKGIVDFANEMIKHAREVRESSDHPLRKSQGPFRYMPWRVARWAVKFLCWLQYDVNLNLSWMGIPRDPFGAVMITAIGTLGIETALAPLAHIGRSPLQIAVGKVMQKPVVFNNAIEIRQRLNLCCTLDHRFMDGLLGAKMIRLIKELFENVEVYADLIEGRLPLSSFSFPWEKNKAANSLAHRIA